MADPVESLPTPNSPLSVGPLPSARTHAALSQQSPFSKDGEPGSPSDLRRRRRSRDIPIPIIEAKVRSESLPIITDSRTSSARFDAINTEEDANLALPIASPRVHSTTNSHSPDRIYFPHQPKSLAGIALRSFCLGTVFTLSLALIVAIGQFTGSPLWRIPFFFAALSLFHFLEFWTTAAYNTRVAEVSSFLLTSNWPHYAIAHTVATLECLLTNLYWPERSWAPWHTGRVLCLLGFALVVIGQTVRSVAMIQAGPSFNHMVQHQRNSGHVLVTTGIYGRFRHPSYFGFFWWALGTQLVLGNVIGFLGYALFLWRFFSRRIKEEEASLVRFFGDEYVNYRGVVGTKIPFVR
ncbi:hypothetical protein OQA88_314 [Cercophora sp. LCS_1]